MSIRQSAGWVKKTIGQFLKFLSSHLEQKISVASRLIVNFHQPNTIHSLWEYYSLYTQSQKGSEERERRERKKERERERKRYPYLIYSQTFLSTCGLGILSTPTILINSGERATALKTLGALVVILFLFSLCAHLVAVRVAV